MAGLIRFLGSSWMQDDREKDRWVSLAFVATAIAGQDKDNQALFLRSLLDKFEDIPDGRPDPSDTQALAKFAVKLLLRALLDDGQMQLAADMALQKLADELALALDDRPPPS